MGRRQDDDQGGRGSAYPLAFRMRVVRSVREKGVGLLDVAQAYGLSPTTVSNWLRLFDAGGSEALTPRRRGPKPGSREAGAAKRQVVVATRREHPSWGTRRIRDELARREGVGVSETEVRRMLHEEQLIEGRPASEPREHPERRFERAEPNQLWQSDIFTFLLRRHQRLYVAAFMDDHSRFLVGWSLAHHQRSDLVMEALRRGIAAYGAPHEILTDQGRQYTAWRGETEFEQELRREGIRHIKSRPQHPQTLGKIERFWKTLWDEFLSKTVFADFADCVKRIGLFVDAYNFQRPHQALGGLVPADRFFRAAPQVRAAIERTVQQNALRLAHEKPLRKPFYLVGRLGDRDLTIATAERGLRVQVGDEAPQTIELPKEDEHEQTARPKATEQEPSEGDTAMADRRGARRDGTTPVPDGAERAQWREDGERRDRRGEDCATDLLPNRGTRVTCDALGTASCDDGRRSADERGAAGGDVAEEGGAARAGEEASGEAAAPDAEGSEAGAHGAVDWPSAQAAQHASIGQKWEQVFAGIEDDDEHGGDSPHVFDPDDGWRGRAVSWERKLTSADARVAWARDDDGEQEDELRAGARGAGGAGGTLDRDAERAERTDDGERSGTLAGAIEAALSHLDASWDGGADGGDRAAPGGSAGALEAGAGVGARERAALARERPPAASGGDDRPHPDGDGATGSRASEPASAPAEEDDADQRRGGGAS
ncbi:MAG TPA: IS481 family transposase [Polyangiaceae bacterium]